MGSPSTVIPSTDLTKWFPAPLARRIDSGRVRYRVDGCNGTGDHTWVTGYRSVELQFRAQNGNRDWCERSRHFAFGHACRLEPSRIVQSTLATGVMDGLAERVHIVPPFSGPTTGPFVHLNMLFSLQVAAHCLFRHFERRLIVVLGLRGDFGKRNHLRAVRLEPRGPVEAIAIAREDLGEVTLNDPAIRVPADVKT